MLSKRAIMLVGGTTIVFLGVWRKKESLREYASSLCQWMSAEPQNETDLIRYTFTDTNVAPVVAKPDHTHALAAGARTAATETVLLLASLLGVDPYVVGMSRSDQKRGLKGSRQWFWPKDVNASNCKDPIGDTDLIYMCDVDYYIDMPKVLAEDPKAVVLYTMVPETASATNVDNTSYCFNDKGELVTIVSGGGKYQHSLWDYGKDAIRVTKRKWGVPLSSVVYAVERKQVAKNRQLVLLAPMKTFGILGTFLASWLLEEKPLERLNPIVHTEDGNFVRMKVVKPTGDVFVSISRPNSFLCATVSASIDEAIGAISRLGSTKLQLPSVASWLDETIPNAKASAAVLTEYHRTKNVNADPYVFPVTNAVRAYLHDHKRFTGEERPKLTPFMSPIIHGAFTPYVCRASEDRCVDGRINNLKKPEPKHNHFRDKCMDEFAKFVCGGTLLHPKMVETVEEKQTTPAQKQSLVKAFSHGPVFKRILKCFIKAEAYPDVKDPRNISTYDDLDKLDMATFALALSEHCKQFVWYGPGKTPLQIATRVAEICSKADFVNVSDYHRMDGTISYTLRNVDRMVCMKAFPNHRAHLNQLLERNVDNKGYLPNGASFEQGSSHGSGCSATSLFQTLRAAFTSYLAYRHTQREGVYLSPEAAFGALGIHLGDDGLDADLEPKHHEWAAKSVGLVLEAAVVARGYRGVNFLARYYSPEVWNGSLNSMCDVKRQLAKFHTTVRLPENVPHEIKLVEKSMSYVATDKNTPVIGPFCRKVLLLSPFRPERLLNVGTWWGKFADSDQYPNENVDGWMDVEFEHHLPDFDRQLFDSWLDSVKHSKDLLCPPLCREIEPPSNSNVSIVVDGDVIAAKRDKDPQEVQQEEAKQRSPSEDSCTRGKAILKSRKRTRVKGGRR